MVVSQNYRDPAIVAKQTNANGALFSTFDSIERDAIDVINQSGTDIEIQLDGSGATIKIADGQTRFVVGIKNANQVGIRRVDQSNTQVNVSGYAVNI